MIHVTSKNDKRQLQKNTQEIEDLQANDVPTFERVYLQSSLKNAGSEQSKIFQVRSHTEPSAQGGNLGVRYGIYNCIELFVNNKGSSFAPTYLGWDDSTISAFGETDRLADENGFTPYDTDQLFQTEYDEWDSGTSYDSGDKVEVLTDYTTVEGLIKVSRVYIAITANTNKTPSTNTDDWRDLTSPVLNLSEVYTMNNAVPRHAKLAKYDIIKATSSNDNTGTSRWSGVDAAGPTRLFYLTGDTVTATVPICNIAYGELRIPPPDPPQATEGEINYNVAIQNAFIFNTSIDFSTLDVAFRYIQATWHAGQWLMSPTIGFGLSDGIESDSGGDIIAKVDETTIGINGSGELEQIP